MKNKFKNTVINYVLQGIFNLTNVDALRDIKNMNKIDDETLNILVKMYNYITFKYNLDKNSDLTSNLSKKYKKINLSTFFELENIYNIFGMFGIYCLFRNDININYYDKIIYELNDVSNLVNDIDENILLLFEFNKKLNDNKFILNKFILDMNNYIKDEFNYNNINELVFEFRKSEQERLEQEKIEQERLEKEILEQERLERIRIEQERFEQERFEQERLEQEVIESVEELVEEEVIEELVEEEMIEELVEEEMIEESVEEEVQGALEETVEDAVEETAKEKVIEESAENVSEQIVFEEEYKKETNKKKNISEIEIIKKEIKNKKNTQNYLKNKNSYNKTIKK